MPQLTFGPFALDPDAKTFSRDGDPQDIQPLTYELLEHAARHPRVLLDRERLQRTLWPDVAVTDHSLTQLVHRIRKLLGEHRGWWVTVPRRGYRFEAPIIQVERPSYAAIGVDAPTMERPLLFGRAETLTRLMAFLDRGERVLSLLGPGGIGKTVLARAVLADRGGCFVDLSAAQTEEDVAIAIATALDIGVPDDDVSVLERLTEALRNTRGLMVLDNAEQVCAALAGVVPLWLAGAPRLVLMITSRVPLAIEVEQRFSVGPISSEAGLQLLTARVERLDPDRAQGLDPHAMLSMAAAVDGHPLALELLAPGLLLTSPTHLAAQLPEGMPMLSATVQGRPTRHQSLDAAMRWSWDALPPDTRAAAVRLSAFRAVITGTLAMEVLHRPQAFAELQRLRDASWLVSAKHDGLRMLSPIRAFVGASASADERADADRRHSRAVLAAAPTWATIGFRTPRAEHLDTLRSLSPDLSAIAERTQDAAQRAEATLRLALLREADGLADYALQSIEALDVDALPHALAARTLLAQSRLVQPVRGATASISYAQEGRRRAEAAGDALLTRYANLRRADPTMFQGDLDTARQLVESSIDPRLEDDLNASGWGVLSMIHLRQGEIGSAETTARTALRIGLDVGNDAIQADAHGRLASVLAHQGLLSEELRQRRLALAAARRYGSRIPILGNLLNLATQERRGQPAAPNALLDEALSGARRTGNLRLHAYAASAMAQLRSDLGDSDEAISLFDESISCFERAKNAPGATHAILGQGMVYACAGDARTALSVGTRVIRESGTDANVVVRWRAHWLAAIAAVVLKDGAEAIRHGEALLILGNDQQGAQWRARGVSLLGAGHVLAGQHKSGSELLQDAKTLAATCSGADPWRVRALMGLQLNGVERQNELRELQESPWYQGDALTRAFVDLAVDTAR